MLKSLLQRLIGQPKPKPPWECGCAYYCPGIDVTEEEIDEYYRKVASQLSEESYQAHLERQYQED